MNAKTMQTGEALRNLFIQQLNLLKVNREKVPLHVLKTK